MVKTRLAKLENATAKLHGGWRCPQCGSTPGGVAKIPIVTFRGEPQRGTMWGEDGRCTRCGSEPSHVIRITCPDMPTDAARKGGASAEGAT